MAEKTKARTPEDVFKTHKHVPDGVNDTEPFKPVPDDTDQFLKGMNKQGPKQG